MKPEDLTLDAVTALAETLKGDSQRKIVLYNPRTPVGAWSRRFDEFDKLNRKAGVLNQPAWEYRSTPYVAEGVLWILNENRESYGAELAKTWLVDLRLESVPKRRRTSDEQEAPSRVQPAP